MNDDPEVIAYTLAAHRSYGRALSEIEAEALREMIERAQADGDDVDLGDLALPLH